MILKNRLSFLVITLTILILQACSSVQKPYSTILQTTPVIVKTSIGNVEVWKSDSQLATNSRLTKTAYLIPGFPGSSLENAPLAEALERQGYSTRLINPPGHGQTYIENKDWDYSFDQYGQALYESLQAIEAKPSANRNLLIAHSAGAEMTIRMLLNQSDNNPILKNFDLVLINPWLPSISNIPIPWTNDDRDILKYPHSLIKIFGPMSKASSHKRLFNDPSSKASSKYLLAHEKLTEDLNGWGTFDDRFVNLIIGTTRSQKKILDKKEHYELKTEELIKLHKYLQLANAKIFIVNSAGNQDKIIPRDYKIKLKKTLETKLRNIKIKSVEISDTGHMLQVEQPQQIINAITH